MSHPFFDIVTRDTEPGSVFDLGIDLDGYDGSVYLKPEHVAEMARALGMADKDTVDAMRHEINRLNRLVNALPEEARVLEDGMASLVADFHTRLAVRADSLAESESDTEDESGSREESGDNADSGDSNFLDELESVGEVHETSEQKPDNSSVKRSASVRDDSGNGLKLGL